MIMPSAAVVYGAVLGTLYVLYGIIQVYNGVCSWWLGGGAKAQLGMEVKGVVIPNAFPDPFSGFALITTGLLFLSALYYSARDGRGYKGYLLAGWMLAVVMMALNVIEIASSMLTAYYPVLLGEEPETWSLAEDPWGVAPHMVLGLLALPLYVELKGMLRELFPRRYMPRSP